MAAPLSNDLVIDFTIPAFKKSCLHSIKYITCDCFGILTGYLEKNKLTIANAYPLFHTRILAPPLEAAFQIVESQLVGTNEVIIGIYESLIRNYAEKNKVSDISLKVLEKISENLPFEPIFIKIKDHDEKQDENAENQDDDEGGYVKSYSLDITIGHFTKNGNKEFSLEKNLQKQLDFYDIIAELDKNNHRKIVDFDNHFEDCSLSFLNDFIN